MTVKLFEVRDKLTFIPAIAIKFDNATEAERYLIARAGYGGTKEHQECFVLFGKINVPDRLRWDVYDWDDRTMHNAHNYVRDNFDTLQSGTVIDVEFIRGETDSTKVSERLQ